MYKLHLNFYLYMQLREIKNIFSQKIICLLQGDKLTSTINWLFIKD